MDNFVPPSLEYALKLSVYAITLNYKNRIPCLLKFKLVFNSVISFVVQGQVMLQVNKYFCSAKYYAHFQPWLHTVNLIFQVWYNNDFMLNVSHHSKCLALAMTALFAGMSNYTSQLTAKNHTMTWSIMLKSKQFSFMYDNKWASYLKNKCT